MSNYSDQANSVRVDFFKDTGKWYVTEAVLWKTWKGKLEEGGMLIHTAFAEALRDHLIQPNLKLRLAGMTAVCLEPYHEYSHPIMLKVLDVFDELFGHQAGSRANHMIRGLPVDAAIPCPKCVQPMVLKLDSVNATDAFCPVCVWAGVWKRHGT